MDILQQRQKEAGHTGDDLWSELDENADLASEYCLEVAY